MKLEKTIKTPLPKKKPYKMWGILSLISLYPLYYFLSNLPEEMNFQSLFIDNFESRALLLLIFLVTTSIFLYHYSKRNHFYQMEFHHKLFILDNEFIEEKLTRKNVKTPKGEKTLNEKNQSSVMAFNVSDIIGIEEKRMSGTKTIEQIGISVSGSNTIGDKLGTPLNLSRTTTNYDYMQTYFEYQNGNKKPYSSAFSIDEIKEFLKI
jgi:hypothetical protein